MQPTRHAHLEVDGVDYQIVTMMAAAATAKRNVAHVALLLETHLIPQHGAGDAIGGVVVKLQRSSACVAERRVVVGAKARRLRALCPKAHQG